MLLLWMSWLQSKAGCRFSEHVFTRGSSGGEHGRFLPDNPMSVAGVADDAAFVGTGGGFIVTCIFGKTYVIVPGVVNQTSQS